MRPNQRRRISWSELPPELLLIVAENFVNRNDVINFRESANHGVTLPHYLFSIPSPSYLQFSRTHSQFITIYNIVQEFWSQIPFFLLKPAVNRKKLKPWLLSVTESNSEFKDKNNVDSAVAMNSPLKVAENEGSQSKFLGVEVSSHSIPVLQKIWDKHGNIMEGHVVNSDSLLTWALESLAKTIITLQNNSGRSLDESEAKFLKSILLDFLLMHFKIDWLVPFVEKALALHKNKVIMELEMAKSKLQASSVR